MILKEEPGGWGPETASPASARIEPSLGLITATPPSLPPSAFCAVFCRPSRIVVCSDFPLRPGTLAITRSPKRRVTLRRPAEPVVVDPLQAGRLLARRAGDRGTGGIGGQQPPGGVINV